MKTANKCHKCGAKKDSTKGYACESVDAQTMNGENYPFGQSDLCRERVKVARLKKQVERLKDKLQTAENLAFNLDRTLIKAREMIQELETRNSEVRK